MEVTLHSIKQQDPQQVTDENRNLHLIAEKIHFANLLMDLCLFWQNEGS